MKHPVHFTIVVIMLVGLVAACAPSTPEAVAPEVPGAATEAIQGPEATAVPEVSQPQGELRVGLPSEPTSLYFPFSPDMINDIVATQLYNSLLKMDANGELGPELAESWEISADGTEYTFHLKQGVTFHNGEPFTVDDVIATWEYGKNPDTSRGLRRYEAAATVEKIDDFTVKITTDGPQPFFLEYVAQGWMMIPNDYMAEVGFDGFQAKPVGTGPFQFVEWVKGDRITYEANPNYWQSDLPKAQTLVFRFVPESSTRVAAIQTDEVDIVTRLSPEEAAELGASQDVKVLQYPLKRPYYLTFNNISTGIGQPTMDARVRLAMNHAVDVQAMIDTIFQGQATRASGLVVEGERGFGAVDPIPFDPEKAKQLLAEAGFPDGFTIEMACPAGAFPKVEEVCQAIASDLGKVGIVVDLQLMEAAQYWGLQAEKQLPPLFIDSWGVTSPEAYERLGGTLGGMNSTYSSWSDPVSTGILEEISGEIDTAARTALYEDLQVQMQEDPPFVYLYVPFGFEATQDRVQDYSPYFSELVYYAPVSVGAGE